MKKFALLALLGAAAAGAAAVCVKVIKDRKSNLDADYTECPCEGETRRRLLFKSLRKSLKKNRCLKSFMKKVNRKAAKKLAAQSKPAQNSLVKAVKKPAAPSSPVKTAKNSRSRMLKSRTKLTKKPSNPK